MFFALSFKQTLHKDMGVIYGSTHNQPECVFWLSSARNQPTAREYASTAVCASHNQYGNFFELPGAGANWKGVIK